MQIYAESHFFKVDFLSFVWSFIQVVLTSGIAIGQVLD